MKELEINNHEEEHPDDVQFEKGIKSTQRALESDSDNPDQTIDTGRPWNEGKKVRFPWISVTLLLLICLMCAGIVIALKLSDNHDYDTWGLWTYRGLVIHRPPGHKWYTVKRGVVNFLIPTNVLISVFVLLSGKFLAFAFWEAFTVYWWRQIMKGKSLRALHYDYEFGRSVGTIIKNPRLFNYLCICVIAYTCFAVVGPILQKSSEVKVKATEEDVYMTPNSYFPKGMKNLQTQLPITFPDGGSTMHANIDKSLFAMSFPAEQAEQSYTHFGLGLPGDNSVFLRVDGCPLINDHRPAQACGGYFENIGFDVDNDPSNIWSTALPNTENELFGVYFSYNATQDPGKIHFTTTFKVSEECTGNNSILTRRYTLTPALVDTWIWFYMLDPDLNSWDQDALFWAERQMFGDEDNREATREAFRNGSKYPGSIKDHTTGVARVRTDSSWSKSEKNITWAVDHVNSHYEGLGTVNTNLNTEVINWKPEPSPNKTTMEGVEYLDSISGTLGGLVEIFNNVLSTSYKMKWDDSNRTVDLQISGTFWNAWISSGSRNLCETTFANPINLLLDAVDDLTFRYSVFISNVYQFNTPDFANDTISDSWNPHNHSYVAIKSSYGAYSDKYRATRAVYHTSFFLVGVAVFIMLVSIICTCSLFWGFWRLGRKVTLSPIEMARALQLPQRPDVMPINPNEASNFEVGELVRMLGDVKVKYGEVSPGVLGVGLAEEVNHPRDGQHYK